MKIWHKCNENKKSPQKVAKMQFQDDKLDKVGVFSPTLTQFELQYLTIFENRSIIHLQFNRVNIFIVYEVVQAERV